MNAALLLAVVAVAASPPVAVTGDCPSAEAVTAALGSALGADAPPASAERPRVADLGDRFQVSAVGQVQQYTDPTRNCAERARAAAVFIALALNPPFVPPAPAPREVVVAPAPAPPPPPFGLFDVGVAARLDGGPATAAGAEVRVAVIRPRYGVTATAGLLAPTESTYSSINVRQQRFPLSLAMTARRQLSDRFVLVSMAGVALVPLTISAQGFAGARAETRLDAGFRVAVALSFPATSRLRPFVDLHAELFPRPYHLVVEPLGDVGTTGRFWIGAAVGLAFETFTR